MLQNLQPQNLRNLQELLLEVVVFGFDPYWYQQQQKQHQLFAFKSYLSLGYYSSPIHRH